MAWVQKTHRLLFRFRDNDGAESTCEAHLRVSVPLDTALSFAAALAPLVSALSDAKMITYNVIAEWVETAPAVAGAASVTESGIFLFRTANVPQERYVLTLPAIRPDLVALGGDFAGIQLDATNADVAAFINAMTEGLDGVRPRAPWSFFADIGGGGGSWGGGGGGGSWGGGGGGGPWGGGGGGGSYADPVDWLLNYNFTQSALINSFIVAYRGKANERLRIPDKRI